MLQPILDRLGDLNPQLFRELKGRYKPRSFLITTTLSLFAQLLSLVYGWGRLPTIGTHHRYCTGTPQSYSTPLCLHDTTGNPIINWQVWGTDLFLWLSIIGVVALWVVGSYLLISDLDREERRGTLNFIRLTPQSTSSLLFGKLLGVPSLLYWATLLALPYHAWLASVAQIPGPFLIAFYAVVLAGCFCFYSAALLYGLISTGLGGFQPWLGSGLLLLVLLIGMTQGHSDPPFNWLHLFAPSLVLAHLLPNDTLSNTISNWEALFRLEWLNFPVGARFRYSLGLTLLNYGLWSYWTWQGLLRCFRNSHATLLSKRQSYGLTVCFAIFSLGFVIHAHNSYAPPIGIDPTVSLLQVLSQEFELLSILGLLFGFGLMGALLPQRQSLQDWARYRHQWAASQTHSQRLSLLKELLWGEKSPGILAFGLNMALVGTIWLFWLLSWPTSEIKTEAMVGLGMTCSMLLVYAAIAQLLLLMASPKRQVWALGTVGAAVILPIVALSIVLLSPDKAAGLWLFSAIPLAGVEHATSVELVLGFLGQISILSFLSLRFSSQIKQLGESASKALFSDRSISASRP